MKLLTVSDKECVRVYSSQIKERFKDVDLAIGCGDLSYYYLEYIISSLDVPLYYVRGNHAKEIEYGCYGSRQSPWGAINLHKKVRRDKKTGLILSGIQGSLRYNDGDYQYSQAEMWAMVMQLVPSLIWNKIRHGRYLDIFVTHAPPWGIHDRDDPAHQGVKAFNWLIKTFQPAYHLHGHVHVYTPSNAIKTKVGETMVLNSYGYRKLVIGEEKDKQAATDMTKTSKMKYRLKKKLLEHNLEKAEIDHSSFSIKSKDLISKNLSKQSSASKSLSAKELPTKDLTAVEHLSKSDAG